MSPQIIPSQCLASGQILVSLTGTDAGSLTNILYYLDPLAGSDGTPIPGQSSNLLSGLLPGAYKLRVTANCGSMPVSQEQMVYVPGNYVSDLTYRMSTTRTSVGSCMNGQMGFNITGGRMPYTLRIIDAPNKYTGVRQFKVTGNDILIDSLPAGSYWVDVIDSCGTKNEKVFGFVNFTSFGLEGFGNLTARSDCRNIYTLVELHSGGFGHFDKDYFVKWRTAICDVYGKERIYSAATIGENIVDYDTIVLPAGRSLSDYYREGAYYKRWMTNSCGDTQVDSFKLKLPPTSNELITYNCDSTFNYSITYRVSYATSDKGIFACFPLTLSFTNKDDNTKVFTSQAAYSMNDGTLLISHIPYGKYIVALTTSDGMKIKNDSTVDVQNPGERQFSVAPTILTEPAWGANGTAMLNVISTAGFPPGTVISQIYPYAYYTRNLPQGSTSNVVTYSPTPVKPGYYILRVTTPCDTTDLPIWLTESDVLYYHTTYRTEPTCAGLKVTVDGYGSVGEKSYPLRFIINGPSSKYGFGGDSVILTEAGDYNLYVALNLNDGTGMRVAEGSPFTYTKSSISIVQSSGWICPSAANDAGRIYVLAQGGESPSNKYKYYLSEVGNSLNGPFLEIKDTGYFTGNSTYKLVRGKTYDVKIANDCNVSVVTSVTVSDFDANQLIVGGTGLFCYGDKIKLKVNNLPLGASSYEWTGPGLAGNVTRYMQQLTINRANYSTGGMYTVTVNAGMCDNPIVATRELKMAESYPFCYSAVTDTFVNPVRIGMYNNWHPSKSYVYYGQRSGSPIDSLTNIRVDGTYSTFSPFWQLETGKWKPIYDTAKWVWNAESTIFNLKGFELENRDPLGRYNSGLYGYADALPVAIVQNGRYSDVAYDGFEDYFLNVGSDCADTVCAVGRHFDFSAFQNSIDSTQHHTGRFSMRIEAGKSFGLTAPALAAPTAFSAPTIGYQSNACVGGNVLKDIRVNKDILIPAFTPVVGKQMLFSIWIKEEQPCNCTSYSKTSVMVYVGGDDSVRVASEAKPTGVIIDGWQRYEQVVRLAKGATSISFSVQAPATTRVFFDDLRFHPYNANMKSFVYDATSLRLMAELDENNYASFYEYDDDGTIVRVKKETERGVKTISETRSALLKEDGQ